MKRRGHVRLLLFFLGLALLGSSLGAVWANGAGEPRAAIRILVACVTAVALSGFLGVFWHRRTIAKIRWRETEDYLARIRRESDKYRALMEGAADILLIVDPESGLVRECNAMAREALGITLAPSEPGQDEGARSSAAFSIDSILADAEREEFRRCLRAAVATPGPPISLSDVRLRATSSRPIVADARFAAIELEDRRVIQVSLRDLTREKEMERQLSIHERLSTIGLLTSGVAHEINNPLEGIGNYLALLERPELSDADRHRYLALVDHGFARIRDIVRELLHFARPDAGRGTADLSDVVDRAIKLISYSSSFRGMAVERHGLDRPLLVTGDPGRLEQVVFNLLLNAANAMQSKGKITIRAARTASDVAAMSDETAGSSAETRGAIPIELSVLDDGPGIPEDDLDKIFDPFFTTGAGTGLGLSVSYGIVRAHGGDLTARNREGGGAEFTIRLPWPGAAEEVREVHER